MEARDFLPGDGVIAGIRADIDRYEAERSRVHRAVMWRVPVLDGLWIAAILGVAHLFNRFANANEQWLSTPHVFLYIIGFFTLFFIHGQAVKPARTLQQSLRERIMPLVFGFIEEMAYRHEATPESFARMPQEASGAFNRQNFDDVISGRYEGFPFELYEATLSQKSGKSRTSVFKGVIVAFETITPFPGLLVATRKSGRVVGFLEGLFGGSLEELKSGVAALDENYEFRTDHVEAARPLVTGRLAQALQWLNETWPEQPARVALKGSDGFLLIPLSKNFFELPGISQPLDYKADVEPMIADMGALLATAALVRKIGAPKGGAPE
ncbi:MAG: DUF3137 domain-containing protein [Hyphomicrobiales bacterium]|nr:DUF3137 domain-containing protein [Hyphomicrobiales bacterium]